MVIEIVKKINLLKKFRRLTVIVVINRTYKNEIFIIHPPVPAYILCRLFRMDLKLLRRQHRSHPSDPGQSLLRMPLNDQENFSMIIPGMAIDLARLVVR